MSMTARVAQTPFFLLPKRKKRRGGGRWCNCCILRGGHHHHMRCLEEMEVGWWTRRPRPGFLLWISEVKQGRFFSNALRFPEKKRETSNYIFFYSAMFPRKFHQNLVERKRGKRRRKKYMVVLAPNWKEGENQSIKRKKRVEFFLKKKKPWTFSHSRFHLSFSPPQKIEFFSLKLVGFFFGHVAAFSPGQIREKITICIPLSSHPFTISLKCQRKRKNLPK